jgi:hypothetical protein
MATDEPEVITLEDRINALEVELARLRETPGTLGWPNVPTIAQGFLAHRYQRRDAADNQGGIPPAGNAVPEAPADGFYYGRHDLGWAYVAPLDSPALTGEPTAQTPPLGNASTRLATTQFVMANSGGGGGGIPEAPDDTFTYGRHQYGWVQVGPLDSPAFTGQPTAPSPPNGNSSTRLATTQYVALNAATLASPAFTGAPTAPTPPSGNVSTRLATTQFVADNAAAGGVPEAPEDGAIYGRGGGAWTALEGSFASIASPQFTGEPTAPTPEVADASTLLATTQFVARDALLKSGGQMSGPLISMPGTNATNPGLAIGDNSTGFYRPSNGVLVVAAGGSSPAQFMPSVFACFVPINVSNNLIQAVADPVSDTDALNRRTGDSRYFRPDVGGFITAPMQLLFAPSVANDAVNKGYVDGQIDVQRTAPSVVQDIPANVVIPGDAAWHQIAVVRMAIPRGGNSRLMVVVSCNVTNYLNIGVIGVRLGPGTPERQVFMYGVTGATNQASGFSANLTLDVSVPVIDVPIELTSISVGGAPISNFSIVGGDATVATRSQIVIVDLGPTGGSADAVEENPGAGSEQRDAARPNRGRHARTPARAR